MQLTNLFASEDDRAVSPVIGVILMVAITVILAAVIGAFVLGIGGDQAETPQATLDFDCDANTADFEINHRGGDRIDEGELSVQGDVGTNAEMDTNENLDVGGTWDQDDIDTDGQNIEEGDNLVLVHDPSDSIIFDRTC